MMLRVSFPVGEHAGPELRGQSWLTGCPGDRLSLLCSSHDELSPNAFGNFVSKWERRLYEEW